MATFLVLAIGEAVLDGVRELAIDKALGRPSKATLTVRLPEPLPPGDLLGQPARVMLGREAAEQIVDGVVTEARLRLTELEGAFAVRLVIESRLALLRGAVDHRAFLDKDVKEIVTEVLAGHGLGEDRQRWGLSETYEKRPMTVQHAESDWDFVSRLCEDEGITLFLSEDDDGELVTFTDRTPGAEPIEGDARVAFSTSGGLDGAADCFVEVEELCGLTAGKVTLRDYDFTKPSLDVKGEAEDARFAELERYEAHRGSVDPVHLARQARVLLEAEVATRRRIVLGGHCLRATPGRALTLEGAPGSLDGKWLVVEATHRFSQGVGAVSTRVVAQPVDVPFRSPATTPRPIVVGHDTAFVVAPDGSEPETIHTDEHGRVKVRFRWDRSGRAVDDASAWMRVAQLQTAGSQVLPRIGWEVLVEYLEGDPDRPVVTGRVYNGATPPPYALPEGRTRTALQSASTPGGDGRNEIRLEDAAGKEEVAISAQKNQTIAVANDSTESIVSNFKKEIGSNLTLTVGGDETVRITSGVKSGAASEDVSVGGSRDVKVDAVMGLAASGAIETSIGGSLSAQIGSPLKGLLDLAGEVVQEAVEAKVKEAAAQIQEKAKAAVDQLLGSVGDLASKAGAAGAAAGSGDLGAALGAAAGLPSPGASSLGAALGMDAGLAGLADAAMQKVGEAMGSESGGGSGESEANEAGPDGALPANAAAQGACGPGHSILHALATLDESVGGSKVTLAAGKVTTAVGGARTISVGAARVELVGGDRAETCTSKTEEEAGRVVIASGAISEATAADRSTKVGGAILEKVGGSATLKAGGNLALIGALWKVTAKSAIVLECGGSKVTIAGGGIEISTPALTLTAPTIKVPKSGTET